MSAGAKLGDLGIRSASAVGLVAIALGSAYAGGTAFLLVWLAASAAVHWEWQRLIGGNWLFARVVLGSMGLVALVLATELSPGPVTVIVMLAMVAGGNAWLGAPDRRWWAAGGFVYAGAFLVSVVVLRLSALEGGRAIAWLFATVWSTDVFAYFGGRLIGGPKFWPRVSPSKTWSGTLTGVFAGGAVGTVTAMYHLQAPTSTLPIIGLTTATAIVSQAGDAFESAIKRRFGVKDSSRLIPGHGGVMDRLDGFIAAAVFAGLIAVLRGEASTAVGLFHWA